MENAIILHGGYSSPKHYWFPSIKQILVKNGYDVWIPQLPDTNNPNLTSWLPFVLKNGTFRKNTILVSHSLGSTLALSVLERLKTPIFCAILVSGFSKPRGDYKEPVLQKKYDWKKIKSNVKDLMFINSKNDPWGCHDKQGLSLWKHLGGTLVLLENEGHMGSESFHQPYKRFYLLEKLLELEFTKQEIDDKSF